MEAKPESARKQASREATEWFILLQEEPDDRDLHRRFNEWREASPLNAAAWSGTQRTSDLAVEALPAYSQEWESLVARKDARQRRRWPKRRRTLFFMASGVAACIALLVAPAAIVRLQSDYTTGTAELRSVELQDGSEVTLGPSSAIAVSYDSGERRVRLLQGEAFFAVRPNPERPFRVAARSVEASVLGTSFDVRLDESGVVVSVQEGTVRVDSAAVAETLEAGQSVRMTRTGEAHRTSQTPQLIAAWRQGQLLLQNRPLSDAVDELRRYFGGTIILADPSLGDRPVTGVFNLNDPEEALRGIAQVHGAKVRRITPWVLVVSSS